MILFIPKELPDFYPKGIKEWKPFVLFGKIPSAWVNNDLVIYCYYSKGTTV